MRILFTSTPAFGHVLPMLPLVDAARRAGHETALMTHPSVAGAAPSLRLLPVGPSVPETLADVMRRTQVDALNSGTETANAGPVEFFVNSRMSLAADAALEVARDFRPDLVVSDMVDYAGQFAAAALERPWVAHGASLPLFPALAEVMEEAAVALYAERGVTRTAPIAYVDPWPDSLLESTDVYPVERVPVRAEPHAGEGPAWTAPAFTGREDRPLILVSLGTMVEDADVLTGILDSLAALDVNVIVAPHTEADLEGRPIDRTRVHVAGFVPMRDLLQGVVVVVSAAGAGTVLSALSAGLPMVLLPLGLDKPTNAARAAAVGAARVVSAPEEIGDAVGAVLAESSFAGAAQKVAAEIEGTDSADVVLSLILEKAGLA